MLKKTFLFFSLFMMLVGLLKVSAQQKIVLDKIVAVVGNSIILYSDLEEYASELEAYRKENGIVSMRDPQIEALEMLMTQKLLFNQAKIDSIQISSGVAEQQAEERVMAYAQDAGGVRTLEALYHRPIYDIKREFASRIEERMYSEGMRDEIVSKVRITPGEVERYYKKIDKDSLPIIPAQYVYAQITKFPLSTPEAKQRARESLLDMRKRILEGTRFEVLARLYSQDTGSKNRGGEVPVTTSNSFEPNFARALEKLQPGDVSEIVETVYGFHIINLIDRPEGQYHLRHILVRPEFSDVELKETNASLDSLARQIRADSISFERAAINFSDDKYSKYNGGLVSNLERLEVEYGNVSASAATTKHMMDELSPDDYNALKDLTPGEVSEAFNTEDPRKNAVSKIVKLIEIIPAHTASLKEDYLRLEELALQTKQQDELRKWVTGKIDGMYVRIDPQFRKPEEFENKSWFR